jgi:hypothetical protein
MESLLREVLDLEVGGEDAGVAVLMGSDLGRRGSVFCLSCQVSTISASFALLASF